MGTMRIYNSLFKENHLKIKLNVVFLEKSSLLILLERVGLIDPFKYWKPQLYYTTCILEVIRCSRSSEQREPTEHILHTYCTEFMVNKYITSFI